MLPNGGQGATNAIQGAVILSNCLYDLKNTSLPSIIDAFKDYRAQRYKLAKAQFDVSNFMPKIMSKIVSDQHNFEKSAMCRPQQLNWILVIPTRETAVVLPQKPSVRYQEEQEADQASTKN
ncbi:hypothetical protein BG011_003126 [Mortierella polycephala]|uniref:Uncharacterized protein n=1 Tax=Mortierella polycephala TaxID=41804 RepID=A0A9P6QFL4_9FUNG|nr:hypothetical protein BG011_003126 [Mortierella polycephala]